MTQKFVTRRKALQTVAISAAAGTSASAQPAQLSDDRMRSLKPLLDRRAATQLKALRDFELDEAIAPTQRIPEK